MIFNGRPGPDFSGRPLISMVGPGGFEPPTSTVSKNSSRKNNLPDFTNLLNLLILTAIGVEGIYSLLPPFLLLISTIFSTIIERKKEMEKIIDIKEAKSKKYSQAVK